MKMVSALPKIISRLPKMVLLLPLLAMFAGQAKAQAVPSLESIQSQADLDKAITTLDAALFDSYNRCDLEKFATFFVDDVEFYHDQGGVTLGKEKLTDSVKKNICGKVTRELVPGTLQVYHMKGYGAVEMGVHESVWQLGLTLPLYWRERRHGGWASFWSTTAGKPLLRHPPAAPWLAQ